MSKLHNTLRNTNYWLHLRYYFIPYSCEKTKLLFTEPLKCLLLAKSFYSSLSEFLCKNVGLLCSPTMYYVGMYKGRIAGKLKSGRYLVWPHCRSVNFGEEESLYPA